jgi:hypothetical protein
MLFNFLTKPEKVAIFSKFQNFLFLDSCFFQSANIYKNELRLIENVTSAFHCQLECQNDMECVLFTYRQSTLTCFLKIKDSGLRRGDLGILAGPKTCAREIGNQSLICKYKQYLFCGCNTFLVPILPYNPLHLVFHICSNVCKSNTFETLFEHWINK